MKRTRNNLNNISCGIQCEQCLLKINMFWLQHSSDSPMNHNSIESSISYNFQNVQNDSKEGIANIDHSKQLRI